ncbi:uncharacterized protein LOC143252407 [Tachypleus tridentatus]|uniref:uncharacterized protein LOC143252407 n=1 Tax=Tachypleus tridentatus TaxID=6853 RepID=UPI003FCFBA7D
MEGILKDAQFFHGKDFGPEYLMISSLVSRTWSKTELVLYNLTDTDHPQLVNVFQIDPRFEYNKLIIAEERFVSFFLIDTSRTKDNTVMYFLSQENLGVIQRTREVWSFVSDVVCFQQNCVFVRDAPTNGAIVYRMTVDRTSGQFSMHEIQRVKEVRYAVDVEVFLYASARLVAIATSKDQWIFKWEKPQLEFYQKIIDLHKGIEWKHVPTGVCHSEPLLVLNSETSKGSTQLSVFRFVFKDRSSLLPKLERFQKGDGIPICVSWKVFRGSGQHDEQKFTDLNSAQGECVRVPACKAIIKSSGGFFLSFDYHFRYIDRLSPDIFYAKQTDSGFTCHYDIWNSPAKNSMTSFFTRNFEILVVPHERHTIMYRFWYHYNEVPNPKVVSLSNMEKLFFHLKRKIDEQEKRTRVIEERLKNSVRQRGNQVIQNRVVSNHFSSDGFFGALIGNKQTLQTMTDASLLAKNIEDLEIEVEKMYSLLEDVVLINSQIKTLIKGTKVFKGQVLCDGVEGREITLYRSRDINVQEMLAVVTRKDREPLPVQDISFTGRVHVRRNVKLGCCINKIATPELFTTNTEQHIDGTLEFLSPFQAESIVSVNRINAVPPTNIVSLQGNTRITTHKTFSKIIVNSISGNSIDGVNVTQLSKSTLLTSGKQTLEFLRISSQYVKTNDITLSGKINNMLLSSLIEDLARVDTPTIVPGHKIFKENFIIDEELVAREIDGIALPRDLLLSSMEQTISAKKEFLQTVMTSVNVTGYVDHVRLPYDVASLRGSDYLQNTITFNQGLLVNRDIHVYQETDGVDISWLERQVNELTRQNLGKLGVIINNLEVHGRINEVDVQFLHQNSISHEDEIVILSRKTFTQLNIKKVEVIQEQIRGVHLSDYMNVHSTQDITGNKIFRVPVNFSNLKCPVVDNVGQDILSLFKLKPISDVHVTDFLVVHGYIDGVDINAFVIKNVAQEIGAQKTITTLYTNTLNVQGDVLSLSGKFHDSFGRLISSGIRLSEEETWRQYVIFGNNFFTSFYVGGTVNNVDFQHLVDNRMSLYLPQNISVPIYLEYSPVVSFGDVNTSFGISGVRLHIVDELVVKLTSSSRIDHVIFFRDTLVCNNVNSQLIKGVNLQELVEDVVFVNEVNTVKGLTVFHREALIQGNIKAARISYLTINLKELFSEDNKWNILLITLPQNITGFYTFQEDVSCKNFDGEVFIGKIKLADLAYGVMKTDKPTTVNDDLIFLSEVDVETLFLQHDINDIPLEIFSSFLISQDCTKIRDVSENSLIREMIVQGNLKLELVNGENFAHFINDVVDIFASHQYLSSKKFLDNVVLYGDIEVAGNLEVGDTVSDVYILQLATDAVYVGKDALIRDKKTFKHFALISEIVLYGKLNSIKLSDTILPNERTRQDLKFQSVVVRSEVKVSQTVNGVSLINECTNTWLQDKEPTPLNLVTKGTVTFLANVSTAKQNEVPFSSDTSKTFTFHFKDCFRVNGNLKGLINSINLTLLTSEAVLLDTEQDIEKEFIFVSPVQFGYEVAWLEKISRKAKEISDKTYENERLIEYLQHLAECFTTLDYWVMDTQFQHRGTRLQSFNMGNFLIVVAWIYDEEYRLRTAVYSYRPDSTLVEFKLVHDESLLWYVSKQLDREYLISVTTTSLSEYQTHDGTIAVFRLRRDTMTLEFLSVLNQYVQEALVIEEDGHPYMVVLRKDGTVGFYDVLFEEARRRGEAGVSGVKSLLSFNDKNITYLVVSGENGVEVLVLNNGLLVSKQWISCTTIDFCSYFKRSFHHYLVCGQNNADLSSGGILVFKTNDYEEFKLWQVLQMHLVKHLTVFTFGCVPDVFLVVLDGPTTMENHEQCNLIVYHLVENFHMWLTIPMYGGSFVHTFEMNGQQHLAVCRDKHAPIVILEGVNSGCHEDGGIPNGGKLIP